MNESKKGLIFSQIAAISYSSFGLFARLLKDFDPIFQFFSKQIPIFLVTFVIWKRWGKKKSYSFENKWMWLIYIITTPIAQIAFFVAAGNIPLSQAYFLFYATSIVVNFLIDIFIQKATRDINSFLSVLAALVGIFFINYSLWEVSLLQLFYISMTILSGMSFSVLNYSSKVLSNDNSPFFMLAVNSLCVFITLIPVLWIFDCELNFDIFSVDWLNNILHTTVFLVAKIATIFTFKLLDVTRAGIYILTELVYAVLIGVFLFNEVIDIYTALGVLAVGAAFYFSFKN